MRLQRPSNSTMVDLHNGGDGIAVEGKTDDVIAQLDAADPALLQPVWRLGEPRPAPIAISVRDVRQLGIVPRPRRRSPLAWLSARRPRTYAGISERHFY